MVLAAFEVYLRGALQLKNLLLNLRRLAGSLTGDGSVVCWLLSEHRTMF